MAIEGGCYCGEIRYVSAHPAQGQLQWHPHLHQQSGLGRRSCDVRARGRRHSSQ